MDSNIENACMIYEGEKRVCIDPSLPIFRLIGKRYTMLVLGVIGNNYTRKNFNDIVKSIPGSSRTIIAKRIKDLVEAGIVKRCQNDIISYELTEFGYKIRKGIICFLEQVGYTSV